MPAFIGVSIVTSKLAVHVAAGNMASKAGAKQKKKKNSTDGHSNTPTNSLSSIPAAEKSTHAHEPTIDDPLTGEELEALKIKEEELVKVNASELSKRY